MFSDFQLHLLDFDAISFKPSMIFAILPSLSNFTYSK